MVGNWQLFPSTMPLTIAANVVNMRAWLPFGSLGNNCLMVVLMVRYTRRLSLIGSLLFFLGGKNIVYPMWQSSFVKVSGNQSQNNISWGCFQEGKTYHRI